MNQNLLYFCLLCVFQAPHVYSFSNDPELYSQALIHQSISRIYTQLSSVVPLGWASPGKGQAKLIDSCHHLAMGLTIQIAQLKHMDVGVITCLWVHDWRSSRSIRCFQHIISSHIFLKPQLNYICKIAPVIHGKKFC